jgi:hypothetical protein
MTRTFIIGLMFVCSNLSAQSKPGSDSLGTVSITTAPAGADVYVDSVFAGKSPVQRFGVAPGQHRIKAFYPSVFAWNAVIAEEAFSQASAEHQEKRLALGEVMRIQSEPPGSMVKEGGAELGTTPLYARFPTRQAGALVLQKDGYDSLSLPPGDGRERFLRLRLMPQNGLRESMQSGDVVGTNGALAPDHALAVASSAAMIVSGVASAFMKDRANRNFDSYLLSNDPADLAATRRLDRGALAALILSQISFALLSYLLLSE